MEPEGGRLLRSPTEVVAALLESAHRGEHVMIGGVHYVPAADVSRAVREALSWPGRAARERGDDW